jgi:hypothetical protein
LSLNTHSTPLKCFAVSFSRVQKNEKPRTLPLFLSKIEMV